jgi:hypothetical protein
MRWLCPALVRIQPLAPMPRIVTGGTPYAIGHDVARGQFFVRTIRYGKLAASFERRDGERIYRVMLTLADLPSRPEPVLTRRHDAGAPY